MNQSSEATFTVPAPTLNYADRISTALRGMQTLAEQRLERRLVGTKNRHITVASDDGQMLNKTVFSVETEDTSPDERADLMDFLFDYLLAHQDMEIRADVSVEVY